MRITVRGLVFAGPGKEGDFAWMITRPEHARSLFIFNDNEEQFVSHRSDPKSVDGCARGGGNAVVRPYQCLTPPQAAGVPTGSRGIGYGQLTAHVRMMVDDAIEAIRTLLETGDYGEVIYSASDDSGALGTGIFSVGDEVKRYVVASLKSLART